MKARFTLVVLTALFSLSTTHLLAGPVLFESFEPYKRNNGGALDANLAPVPPGFSGVNSGPNGGPGNGRGGPAAPNLRVVGAEFGVNPHSGTNMVRGVAASGFAEGDTDFYNIAYRLHGSNVYSGNILLDWWFYDPVGHGANAADFQDYLSLANYNGIPTNSDYVSADNPGTALKVLSLGGGQQD